MRGILLDPVTGKPQGCELDRLETILRAPAHVLASLRRANPALHEFQPVATIQGYEEVKCNTVADGTAITGTAETVVIPDVLNYVFPAGFDGLKGGSLVKVTARGVLTTDASAATLTFRLRHAASGSGATGTLLAASAATAPSNSQTNASWQVEFITTIRGEGTAAASYTQGHVSYPGVTKGLIPATGAATVNIDTTVPRLFAITAQWAAAESLTCHQYIVEWMR
jgi:hypothetical protein